jgi:transcriptional regulator with XRE-family HTH domain
MTKEENILTALPAGSSRSASLVSAVEAATASIDTVAASIGRHVRALRTARGWSLDELAQRSGVSKGMVVQIEGARTNPSVGTLCRIAEAFGVHLGQFFDEPAEPVVRVIGADEPPTLWKGSAGGTGRLLRGVNEPTISELWDWRFLPGERQVSSDHSPGTREIVHVRTGVFTVVVDQTTFLLHPGETIDFRADRPHEYRNDGAEPVNLTMVVAMPPGEFNRSRS